MTSNMQIEICGQLPRFRQRKQPDLIPPAHIGQKAANTQQEIPADTNEDIEQRFSKDELVSILERYLL